MGEGLESAQEDWIGRLSTQVTELLPEKSRATWRGLIMKLRRTPGSGIQLSMRVRNAMGMERPIEPNPAAQQAAKELHAMYTGFGKTQWELIEVRFSQNPGPDDGSSVVTCRIFVDPDKAPK